MLDYFWFRWFIHVIMQILVPTGVKITTEPVLRHSDVLVAMKIINYKSRDHWHSCNDYGMQVSET